MGPLASLAKAAQAKEMFVLVSRACVFDIGVPVPRREGDIRGCRGAAGECLKAAEDAVLAYGGGVVVRVEMMASEVGAMADGAKSGGPWPDFVLRPASLEAVEWLAGRFASIPPKFRVFHLSGGFEVSLSEVVYRRMAADAEGFPSFTDGRRGWLVDTRLAIELGRGGLDTLLGLNRHFSKMEAFSGKGLRVI